jgi:outer membrane protein TolC
MVAAAQADAEGARDQRLPNLQVQIKAVATKEPVAAFGLRLDEQRIAAADFDPARLNSPDLTGGVGASATIMQPLYMGGRLNAGRRAAEDQAQAERWAHGRRLQEMAFNVVQAYFAAQVSKQALAWADDVLTQARETESFARARNEQGLALDADVARATAFRAQAEADRTAAVQRLESARAGLVLLVGDEAVAAELTSPLLDETQKRSAESGERPDLRAAQLRADAAREMVTAARGSLLPQVMAQATVETMRSALDQGALWYTVGLVARWQLSAPDLKATTAARRRAEAAESARRWQIQQAAHEAGEAERSLQASHMRVSSAREAVAASESARSLRRERHRQGLLPLTDVLDAEAGLAGARALLLRTEFEVRVTAAQLALALGQSIEGVNP